MVVEITNIHDDTVETFSGTSEEITAAIVHAHPWAGKRVPSLTFQHVYDRVSKSQQYDIQVL